MEIDKLKRKIDWEKKTNFKTKKKKNKKLDPYKRSKKIIFEIVGDY